jgi:hypothetical protein
MPPHTDKLLPQTVIALAGRRVDAEDAPAQRFPLARTGTVREKLRRLFDEQSAGTLVSSAACGADLLAIEVARERRIRIRIILPFDEKAFRQASVTDRPGEWGPLYDDACRDARAANELVEMDFDPANGQEAFEAATDRIIADASSIAAEQGAGAVAVAVSDGVSRGTGDLTEYFVAGAERCGMKVVRVDTLR